jgi:hypothetical protein
MAGAASADASTAAAAIFMIVIFDLLGSSCFELRRVRHLCLLTLKGMTHRMVKGF